MDRPTEFSSVGDLEIDFEADGTRMVTQAAVLTISIRKVKAGVAAPTAAWSDTRTDGGIVGSHAPTALA